MLVLHKAEKPERLVLVTTEQLGDDQTDIPGGKPSDEQSISPVQGHLRSALVLDLIITLYCECRGESECLAWAAGWDWTGD